MPVSNLKHYIQQFRLDRLLAEESVSPIPFIVDRLFFLAIRDNQTETVLFMGVVMDPTTVKKPPFIPEPPILPAPDPEPEPF